MRIIDYVEPIRDKETVNNICRYLRAKNERDYIMFMVGIYTALRISDICKLRIGEIYDKKYLSLRSKKTKKQKVDELNPALRKAIKDYCYNKDPDDYLIKSRQGYNKPISRQRAWEIIKDIEDEFGLQNLGTHTMRKTFGYHYYKNTGDVAGLMRIYSHSHVSITLIYIGIIQEDTNKSLREMSYD